MKQKSISSLKKELATLKKRPYVEMNKKLKMENSQLKKENSILEEELERRRKIIGLALMIREYPIGGSDKDGEILREMKKQLKKLIDNYPNI